VPAIELANDLFQFGQALSVLWELQNQIRNAWNVKKLLDRRINIARAALVPDADEAETDVRETEIPLVRVNFFANL
jgi:hypothetical protein